VTLTGSLRYVATGVFFIFWKSQFIQPVIDFWNGLGIFSIGRTLDYSDLISLIALPASYLYRGYQTRITHQVTKTFARNVVAVCVAIVSVFAFTATTLNNGQMIPLEGEYGFNLTVSEIHAALNQNPSIIELKMESEAERFPKMSTDPHTFYADFVFKHEYCNSNQLQFNFVIREGNSESIVTPRFVLLSCPRELMLPDIDTATKNFTAEFSGVFEREVVYRLREVERK